MSNFGLRVSIRFLVYFQMFVVAFRLAFIRFVVKAANEMEDITLGIDEIIEEKVFSDLNTFSLEGDNSDA
jgi:hypothetical protein